MRARRRARRGRAYGLVLSASIGGIAAGALLARLAVSLVGLDATLIGLGTVSLAYGAAVLLHPRERLAPATS